MISMKLSFLIIIYQIQVVNITDLQAKNWCYSLLIFLELFF